MQRLYRHTHWTAGPGHPPNSATATPTNAAPYDQISPVASRSGVYLTTQNSPPPDHGYGTSAPMMPQTTTAASGHGSLTQACVVDRNGDQQRPNRVVGSQGRRRGVLPSAPGRPAAPAAGAGVNGTALSVSFKGADGKFLCPYCTRTYLHAKHLKRHVLRHTGDRPYVCALCREAFSRSDVLKRHFQKCATRRGNPDGVSHLPHRLALVEKSAPSPKASGQDKEGDMMNHLDGLDNKSGGSIPLAWFQLTSLGGDESLLTPLQPHGANFCNSMNNAQMPLW